MKMDTKIVCHFVVLSWMLLAIASFPMNENASSSSSNRPYSRYQVLEIRFYNHTDAASHLQELISKYQLDVWRGPFKGIADVMVAPQQLDDVINFVETRGASYNVKVSDVQRLLESSMDHQHPSSRHRRSVKMAPETVTRRYLRFRQIRQFLRLVARANLSHADVTMSNLGRTFGRRVTPYVTIRQKNSRDVNKQVVVIEAGMHAREWIAPAMAVNIIYKLTLNPDNDPDIEELLEKFDWIIVPVTNPDGYIFSQRKISTRLWRKTRTSLYAHGMSDCFGVDGNRNFGFQWTDRADKGGSSNPCDDNYSGPQGFSEPETRNMRSLLLRLRSRIAVYLSLHSFGQFFLYPWGYDSAAVLEDEEDLREIADLFADVMLQKNRWYETGHSAQVLYAAAGASDDFARGGAGVKYAFTIELSPSDASQYGFLLPARQIARVVNDHWPAFKAITRTIWQRLSEINHPTTTHQPDTTTTPVTTPAIINSNDNNDRDDHTAAASRGSNSEGSDSLTDVTIDGYTFRLNLSDPAVAQWMEYYMQLQHYRGQYSG